MGIIFLFVFLLVFSLFKKDKTIEERKMKLTEQENQMAEMLANAAINFAKQHIEDFRKGKNAEDFFQWDNINTDSSPDSCNNLYLWNGDRVYIQPLSASRAKATQIHA